METTDIKITIQADHHNGMQHDKRKRRVVNIFI